MKRAFDLACRQVATYCIVAVAAVAISLYGGLANTANATLIEYCGVAADNVMFSDLVETSVGMGGPMYGQPFHDSGNILASMGTGFLTDSVGGGVSMVNGRLQMTITAEEGFRFDEINVETIGSFFGFGPDALAMANSFTSVEADGMFYSGGATADQSGPGQSGFQEDYTVSFPETDQVTLTLNTQLLAASGLTSAAFVEASSIRLSINAFTASVPEPSSVWLMAIALLAVNRRRHVN